jgi:hypothetical protein
VRACRGVGVDRGQAALLGDAGEGLVELAQVAAGVRVGEVLLARRRRVVVAHQHVGQAGGEEVILDRVQARRRFGMAGAHVVAAAGRMAEERGRHRSAPAGLVAVLLISLSPARAHALSAIRLSSVS